MGCQDLLEDVPGRIPRRDQGPYLSSPGDLRSFVRATGKGLTGRGSSKSYSIKEETSSKVLFISVCFSQKILVTVKIHFASSYKDCLLKFGTIP